VRTFLRDGYRLDDVQNALVVKPYRALTRVVGGADGDVVDAVPRGAATATQWAGLVLRRLGDGMVTSYLAWAVAGAVLLGVAGVVLS
jgi:NADH-quinone oxidoreductase subunit L